MPEHARYHVKLNPGFTLKDNMRKSKQGQTTISMNKTLSDLLALKLNTIPDSKEARAAVTRYLQETLIDPDKGRGSKGLSHYLTAQAILYVSDNMLSEKYRAHFYSID